MGTSAVKPDEPLPMALLIPGLDGTGGLYYRQMEPLRARYRVCAWSFRSRPDFDYPDLVEELAAATASEQPGSVLVIGESFGGTVAMHFVLRFPEKVRALGLINTFPHYRRKWRVRSARTLSTFLRSGWARTVKNFVAERVLALEGIPLEDRRRYRKVIEAVDLSAYRRRLELIRLVDLRTRLRDIRVPTCLFASGRDRIVPSVPEARAMAAQIPNVLVHEFPRAGHALLLTPGFSLAKYF